MTLTHDSLSRRTGIVRPGAAADTSYAYEPDSDLASMSHAFVAGSGPGAVSFSYGHDASGKDDLVWVHIPRRLKFRGGRAWLSGEAPKRNRLSQPLVKAIKRAHNLLDAHVDAHGVAQQAPPTAHERSLVRLAWLAPDLQQAMLEGRQKPGLCLEDLRCEAIPLCWDDQRRMLAG